VSVRDETEARAAVEGGADIIDIKEPSRGSLGMAPASSWLRVRRVIPPRMILSVALGELPEWVHGEPADDAGRCWDGIDYRKVGLANSGPAWREDWRLLRTRVGPEAEGAAGRERPKWAAVVYLDWELARSPEPLAVIDEAAIVPDCAGVLFDTWDKSRRVDSEPAWGRWIGRVKEAGRFVALAGSLDEPAIRRLGPLQPDIFAVRGAACRDGRRDGPIDARRVARLVAAARGADA
jgi:uncharacterized protein (UPF0264 family)